MRGACTAGRPRAPKLPGAILRISCAAASSMKGVVGNGNVVCFEMMSQSPTTPRGDDAVADAGFAGMLTKLTR